MTETETYVGIAGTPTRNAYYAVQYHVALKGLQAGALLGLVAAPLLVFFRKKAPGRTLVSTMKNAALIGGIVMANASVAAGHFRLKDEPEEAITDRAYRIKHNTGQQKVDKYSLFAGASGLALGLVMGGPLGALQGASVAIGFSIPVYELIKRLEKKDKD